MNPLIIAIPVIVLLAAVLVVAALRRRDANAATGMLSGETIKRDSGEPALLRDAAATSSGREIERVAALDRRPGALEPASTATPAPYVPPDPETIGVTRRQFFNRSIVALFAFGLSAFGASVLAFLWPQPKGGFGSRITVGNVDDLLAEIAGNGGFLYNAEGRMWMTAYPVSSVERAQGIYTQAQLNAMQAGIQVLYQKCPHLGCRVPECATSQWFECPCHGSQYNQAGEKKGGPAPRGMDGFATEVSGGVLTVDTGTVIQGPPIGVNTTGQEAEGPHCVTGGGH